MTELAQVREDFVQLWGAMGAFWGVSPAAARIYGWLLSREEPATYNERQTIRSDGQVRANKAADKGANDLEQATAAPAKK